MENGRNEALPVTLLKALLGAVLGSIPAAFLWVVLGKVGIVAALAGFLMMLGELIACDKMTAKSDMNAPAAIIICAVVMLINVFNCEKIVWCWEIADALNSYDPDSHVSIFDCFINFNELTAALEVQEDFTASLVQSVLYAALGAVAGCFKLFKK